MDVERNSPMSYLHVGVVWVGEDGLRVGVGRGSWGRHWGRHAPEVAGLRRCWWQHGVSGGGAGLHHAHSHWSTLKLRANHRYQLLASLHSRLFIFLLLSCRSESSNLVACSSGWLVSRALISLEFHWCCCCLVSAVMLLWESDVGSDGLETHLDPPLFRTELVSCSLCTVRAPALVRAVSALSPGRQLWLTGVSHLTGLRRLQGARCSLSCK